MVAVLAIGIELASACLPFQHFRPILRPLVGLLIRSLPPWETPS